MGEILVGLGAGEPGFSRHLNEGLAYFIRFLECFIQLSSIDEKRALLSNGWTLAEWMDETIPEEGSRQFRLMFLHILFPDEFERVFSYNSRWKIVNTFQKDRLGADNLSECDIDRLLYRTREDLEREYGRAIDFFEDDVRAMWDINDTGSTNVAEEQTSYSESKETTTEIPAEAVNLIYYGPPGTCRDALIQMLKRVRILKTFKGVQANIKQHRHTLLDVFILHFCEELDTQLTQGLPQEYIEIEDNLKVLKGRLLVEPQIKHNLVQKERLYCRYDEFDKDILINQVIKFTLRMLFRLVHSQQIRKIVNELLMQFDEISDVTITVEKIKSLTFDRTNNRYQSVVDQCRMFMEGFPDVTAGRGKAFSLTVLCQ